MNGHSISKCTKQNREILQEQNFQNEVIKNGDTVE